MIPKPKQIKWAGTEKKSLSPTDISSWADKLKAKKNPFLAPTQTNSVKSTVPYALLGAISVAGFNALATDKLPSKWHLPAHGGLALASLLLPKHTLSAAIGGALFYSAMSETYYKIVKSALLADIKNATK